MNLRLPSSLLLFILPVACMRSGNAPSVQDPYDKAFESIDEVHRQDFIEDLEHSPHQRPDPKKLYLRLFGRFDNREELVSESSDQVILTEDSISVFGDGGFFVNEKLTVINNREFRLETDRGKARILLEVYRYTGNGWSLVSRGFAAKSAEQALRMSLVGPHALNLHSRLTESTSVRFGLLMPSIR